MRATTVRFSHDLWAALEEQAALSGVSVAQFVREAAIGRLAYLQGRRDERAGVPEPTIDSGLFHEPTIRRIEREQDPDVAEDAAEITVRRAEGTNGDPGIAGPTVGAAD